jgi:16S rRNA C967 or C1407 C5-methylase (RsmB/RsmF family)
MHQFRMKHLIVILENFSKSNLPLDRYLTSYYRAQKAIGSKDRLFLSETIYGIIRWQALLDHLLQPPISWQKRIQGFLSFDPHRHLKNEDIPTHIRISFPKNFYDMLVGKIGYEQAFTFCLASNGPAPITIRVNPLKISRDALLKSWQDKYDVIPTANSALGIQFLRKIHFSTCEEFQQGLFEPQDEGSQLIADHIRAKPGDQVLDFCAGAGGKTLAFAHKLQGRGQIYLHDVRMRPLLEARKRLARAGIQNAQILIHNAEIKSTLLGKMNWVIVDAPCTGSGTLRRHPERKWKFSIDELERLTQLQKTIFSEALPYVKPGGHILYATCSILPQENEEQVKYFLSEFDLKITSPPFRSSLTIGGMDGFFGIIFQKPL